MQMELKTIKQLKNILNRYPENTKIFIYDAKNGIVHPIIECSPFDGDDPKLKETDNFITIDYEQN